MVKDIATRHAGESAHGGRGSSEPRGVVAAELERCFDEQRHELVAHCYRMLGSTSEAEDAVQETLIRAWAGIDNFEGRGALRAWIFGIATHVCLDMLRETQRRALPMDLTAASPGTAMLGEPLPDSVWVQPMPDAVAVGAGSDPAEVAASRETIRLAFVAALQVLPPRQRAVLILREVLRWRASEVAELLETSVVSVNSALQRARSRLAASDVNRRSAELPSDEEQALLARYIEAFERFDIEALVSLLHEDATLSMPPYALWLCGHTALRDWFKQSAAACEGERLVAIEANGSPAFAVYRPTESDGGYEPFSIQVLELDGARVSRIVAFLDARLFELFQLPATPPVFKRSSP